MRAQGKPARIVPTPPRPGDTIGIVAPASQVTKDALEQGCAQLRELGFKVFFFESILEQDLYFAGSHERRAWELHQMFTRDYVKAIICARGGYGSNYLLPHLDLKLVREHPKMFMGYSDVTSLLTYLCDQADLVTYHGPMIVKDFAVAGSALNFPESARELQASSPQIRSGEAEGVVYGGCLSILVASLGTPYEIETAGTLLFLEDISAKPFQIDRMLMQLKLAGKLDSVRGIVFGEMPGCVQPGGQNYSLQDIIRKVLADVSGPIGFGLRSGHLVDHSKPGSTLPIGAAGKLSVSDGSVKLRFS